LFSRGEGKKIFCGRLHRIPYIHAHRIPVWAETECGHNLTVFESLPRHGI
jgi:hypothetical protein